MKRLVALLVAVGLVALSIVVRNVIDGDDGDGGTASDDGGGGDDAEGPLVCATELDDVCRQLADDAGLAVVVEDPGDTAARLIGLDDSADPEMAAWLVPAPWPLIVAEGRRLDGQLEPVLSDASDALATTGLTAIVIDERLDELLSACSGQMTGRCLADNAGRTWSELGGNPTWGNVRPGLSDPTTTTAGLVGLQWVVASVSGDSSFAFNDIRDNDAVRTGIENLADIESRGSGGDPLNQMIVIGPGTYDVAVELDVVAQHRLDTSQPRIVLTSVPLGVDITVDVVLVAPEGRRVPLDLADVTAALIDAGWDDASSGPANGTLNPGVYVALQEAWQEAE